VPLLKKLSLTFIVLCSIVFYRKLEYFSNADRIMFGDRMRFFILPILVSVCCLLSAASASTKSHIFVEVTNQVNTPIISSLFDTAGTEGWSISLGSLNNPGSDGSGGGVGNGYLRAIPLGDSKTSYFVAPITYHGDWSTYTVLRVQLRSTGGTYYRSGYEMYGDIFIANGTKSASFLLPRRPTALWEGFTVSLTEDAGWVFGGGATTLQDIRANVTSFQIRAEYGVGGDQSALDNVELFTQFTEVELFTYLPLIKK
jgi:hypothetical protein